MNVTVVILITIVAAGFGALVGWLIGNREATGAKRTAEALRLQLDGVTEERDSARRDAEDRRRQADEAMLERAKLERDVQNFDKQIQQIKEAREDLLAQFKAAGGEVLSKAQEEFLKTAAERFGHSEKASEEKLSALLNPVKESLGKWESNLARVEKEWAGSHQSLNRAIADLSQGNEGVRKEAQRLANVMVSSPKFRGQWGEEHLRTILESAGFIEGVDFEVQESVSDGEKHLRPDFKVILPGDRCMVIDVKCPLTHYEQAFDEDDEEKKKLLLTAHAKAVRSYANDLGKKSYWKQFEKSPDFVVLFIPGEHHLAAAAERDTKLIADAYSNGVIIASTINMLALAKLMAGMWRQEALAEQAHEIHAVGKELYTRLVKLTEHVLSLGQNLDRATRSYNDFVGSLESKVLTQAKRFEELKVIEGSAKRTAKLSPIERSARSLKKLNQLSGQEDAEPENL
jgi:DNA recombination protein RmuC